MKPILFFASSLPSTSLTSRPVAPRLSLDGYGAMELTESAANKRKIMFLEPFSGISGDMMIGALLDLGFGFEQLREQLSLLPLKDYQISYEKCERAGIRAVKFNVHVGHSHEHRSFGEIRRMIESSPLSSWVKEKSVAAFRKLAEAEGEVHGRPADEVCFHEVGAVDSIIDIVGVMIAIEAFAPLSILSSAVNVGKGTVESGHGIYPVPAPATQVLLRGIPVFSNAVAGELTTPTGATLLATLVEQFDTRPMMKILGSGYGAGARQTPGNANVLRVSICEEWAQTNVSTEEQVTLIEATIDDMSPQVFGYFQEKALAAGALDVYWTPVQMKKNRPAQLLTCVCASEDLERLAELMFCETTTIGIRYTVARRKTLERKFVKVQTCYGQVSMKVSLLDGRPVNYVPEFEDCRRIAMEKGVALKEVQAAAVHAYLQTCCQ